jgi:hypothetical protein
MPDSSVRNRRLAAVALATVLLWTAFFAWTSRDLPWFGRASDEAIFLLLGKTLANGSGYLLPCFPGSPYQTKFPPLFPALLSILWRLAPDFPGNLPLAALLGWLTHAALILLSYLTARSLGLSRPGAAMAAAAIGLNPLIAVLGLRACPDVLAACLAMASLLVLERSSRHWSATALAGLVAAAAMLSRSALAPVGAAGVAWLLCRRQYWRAALFSVTGFLPFAAWLAWSGRHLTPTADPVILFQTNYFGFLRAPVSWTGMLSSIGENLVAIPAPLAYIVLPWPSTSGVWILPVLGVVCLVCCGAIWLLRKRGATPYHWFTLVFGLELLLWNFHPNLRFLIPLAPLVLIYFIAGASAIRTAIRDRLPGGRRADADLLAAAAAVVFCLLWCSCTLMLWAGVLDYRDESRRMASHATAMYEWIRGNTPKEALFGVQREAEFHLRTGHQSVGLAFGPSAFKSSRAAGALIAETMAGREQRFPRMRYFITTPWDFENDLPDSWRNEIVQAFRDRRDLQVVYSSPAGAVYRKLSANGAPPPAP